jgi:sphingolipid delta-4 desaturase
MILLGDEHLVSGYRRYRLKGWAVAYASLSFVMMGVLLAVGGWKSVVYLMLAQVFMTGFLHPWMFGLILSNSHFHGQEKYQPSSSYYGWLNAVTFNFGLHTEHHDLATIPWNRLGRLRRIAPEYYDNLVKTSSYALLALKFTFCSRKSLDEGFVNHLPEHDNRRVRGGAAEEALVSSAVGRSDAAAPTADSAPTYPSAKTQSGDQEAETGSAAAPRDSSASKTPGA